MRLHKEELSDGTSEYPSYAWPGGYPIVYMTKDDSILCPDCANGKNGSEAIKGHEDPEWNLVGMDIHHEGPPEVCDHCQVQIESAYGDPDSLDEDDISTLKAAMGLSEDTPNGILADLLEDNGHPDADKVRELS